MATSVRLGIAGRTVEPAILLTLLGLGVALTLGVAAGYPAPATFGPALAITGLAVTLWALARPFDAFLVLAASTVFLVVFNLPGDRGLNPFDFLMVPLTIASVLGTARVTARAEDRAATDPRQRELRKATRDLAVAVIGFYVLAALSIVGMVATGRSGPAVDSAFSLLRAFQGLLLFPVGLWLLRTEQRLHMTIRAMLVGGVLFAVVNSLAVGLHGVKRAGLAWFVNQPEAPIGGPNEGAAGLLFVGVLLLVRQNLRHRARNLALLGIMLAMLVMTASRSGLLASLTFGALVVPQARLRWVFVALCVVAAAVPFVPEQYWTRLAKTITLERGTFEAYTSLIRVYSWKTALAVFLDHPLFGVGYLGFASVSGGYGELRIALTTAESYYLETAAGMGIPGIVLLAVVIVRLFRLDAVVLRHAPKGSLGHMMARFSVPLLVGLMVIIVTGNNFIGMVGLGQLALWTALLVRAGHLAIAAAPPGRDEAARPDGLPA